MAGSVLALIAVGCGSSQGTTGREGMMNEEHARPPAKADPDVAKPQESAVMVPMIPLALHQKVTLESGEEVELKRIVYTKTTLGDDTSEQMLAQVRIDDELTTVNGIGDDGWVAWLSHYRITAKEVTEESAVIMIDRIGDKVGDVAVRGQVARGESLELIDGTSVTFVGHGHKTVPTGGRSPLIVNVEYGTEDTTLGEQSVSLFPPDEAEWQWRDYHFRVTSYEYDKWMELEVAMMSLQPLAVAK